MINSGKKAKWIRGLQLSTNDSSMRMSVDESLNWSYENRQTLCTRIGLCYLKCLLFSLVSDSGLTSLLNCFSLWGKGRFATAHCSSKIPALKTLITQESNDNVSLVRYPQLTDYCIIGQSRLFLLVLLFMMFSQYALTCHISRFFFSNCSTMKVYSLSAYCMMQCLFGSCQKPLFHDISDVNRVLKLSVSTSQLDTHPRNKSKNKSIMCDSWISVLLFISALVSLSFTVCLLHVQDVCQPHITSTQSKGETSEVRIKSNKV